MGNKASAPIEPQNTRINPHTFKLFELIPQNSVVESVTIESQNHFITCVCHNLVQTTVLQTYGQPSHRVTLNFFGLAEFPLFLVDPSQNPEFTVFVRHTPEQPFDLKVTPKFRSVTPEEYSMLRIWNIEYPIADYTGIDAQFKGGSLVFRSKDKDGRLVVRPKV